MLRTESVVLSPLLPLGSAVKPEKVTITKAKNNEFEWEIPQTWNRPCTFFPLSYEVKVVSHRKDCGDASHPDVSARPTLSER